MRWIRGVSGAVAVAIALGCAGAFSQSHEDAVRAICEAPVTCDGCGEPNAPEFEGRLRAHLEAVVEEPAAVGLVGALWGQSDAVRATTVADARDAAGLDGPCPLVDAFERRAEAQLARDLEVLCALPSSCETFDIERLPSVLGCVSEGASPDVAREVARMDLRSGAALARSLDSYVRKHHDGPCALVDTLRGAP